MYATIRKALFIRPLRWKPAVHSRPTFLQSQYCYFYFFIRGLRVVYAWLRQTTVNENTTKLERTCALLLPNVRLALVRRFSVVYIYTRKNSCNAVDAHNKWITFIRRSRQIINEFWRTLSESQSHWPKLFIFRVLDVRDLYMWLVL